MENLTVKELQLLKACTSAHIIALKDQARKFPNDYDACNAQVKETKSLQDRITYQILLHTEDK